MGSRAFCNIVQLKLLKPLKIDTYNLFSLNIAPCGNTAVASTGYQFQ